MERDKNNQETKIAKPQGRKLTQQEIEQRLAKRAEEIKDRIKRSEESQRVTNETMNLEFHTPGVG
jgi:hypothetical protein